MSDKPKNDLGLRSLTALVMLAVAGTALWLGGWVWTVFVTLIALGVLWEFGNLVRGFTSNSTAALAWYLFGLIYVGLAAWALWFVRAKETMTYTLLLVGMVIATDIGAYFAGRTFGGPKIAPSISPSKTWSGLIGGSLGATIVFLLVQLDAGSAFPKAIGFGLLTGTLIAVIAQSGDFFESWMKRRAGVKDSGRLLPGHGGLFDRVDGLLAVCFVLAIAGLFIGRVG